jgi:hypothetical protein
VTSIGKHGGISASRLGGRDGTPSDDTIDEPLHVAATGPAVSVEITVHLVDIRAGIYNTAASVRRAEQLQATLDVSRAVAAGSVTYP